MLLLLINSFMCAKSKMREDWSHYYDPKFLAACRNQSRRLAASDPAGDELMGFIEAAEDWPKA